MTTKFAGEVSAYTPGKNGAKGTYRRIGSFFQGDDGRLSAKIDTLPIPGTGWEGWINFFAAYDTAPIPVSTAVKSHRQSKDDIDDGPPF